MRFRSVAAALLIASAQAAGAAEVPTAVEYRVGDQAEADIVTPIPLVVFDPVRTKALRDAELSRVAPVFRHLPGVAVGSEQALRATFTNAHGRFAAGLEQIFQHPLPLLNAEFGGPLYQEHLKTWREQHPGFPLSATLAELWAFGDGGELFLERQLVRLRRWTNAFIRPDALPEGERLTVGNLRLASVPDLKTPFTLAQADRAGRNVPRTNVLTLSRARQEAQRGTNNADRAESRHVAGFIEANCYFDEELTRQTRTRRLEALNAADRYEAGQVIVRQGETVTERTKLALDELQGRTAAQRVQAAADQERTRVEAEAVHAQRVASETLKINRWLLAGLGGAAAALAGLAVFVFLRRRALLDARRRGGSGMALVLHDAAAEAWRERALAAEEQAQKANAMLRTKMLPHLARWMVQEFAQRLLSQRREILTEHQTAEREVADLADRLQQVHAPLEDRLRAYEKRIVELEAELAEKGEQNRALIQARIESTRQRLETERSHDAAEPFKLG